MLADSFAAMDGVGLAGLGERFTVAMEADADALGWVSGGGVEDVRREFSHSLKLSSSRAGCKDGGILS